jgi:cytochrome b
MFIRAHDEPPARTDRGKPADGDATSEPGAAQGNGASVRVWDPFVRIFHWGLAASFLLAYGFTQDAWLHEGLGYAALALVVLRLPWGLFGPRYARFADFVYRPRVVFGYARDLLRGRARRYLGHNPLGGWSIILMLSAVVVCTVSGILMNTDRFWGNALVEDIHTVSADLTIVLVGVHLLGVLVSSLAHRENLVRAMITGRKRRDVGRSMPPRP